MATSTNQWFLLLVHMNFMRKNCMSVKTIGKAFILYCDKIPNVYFHKAPRCYIKEVQFVIVLNMRPPRKYNSSLVSQTCHIELGARSQILF